MEKVFSNLGSLGSGPKSTALSHVYSCVLRKNGCFAFLETWYILADVR